MSGVPVFFRSQALLVGVVGYLFASAAAFAVKPVGGCGNVVVHGSAAVVARRARSFKAVHDCAMAAGIDRTVA